jgi:hypothetical protein
MLSRGPACFQEGRLCCQGAFALAARRVKSSIFRLGSVLLVDYRDADFYFERLYLYYYQVGMCVSYYLVLV